MIRVFTSSVLILFYLLLTLAATRVKGQSSEHELNTIIKWDIGIAGTWLNFEYPVSKEIALVSEIGLNPIIFKGDSSPVGILLSRLSPRERV